METVGQEAVRGGIVFEDLAGIAAAGRKIDEAALHAGIAARAMEDPVLVRVLVVLIDVEEHIPMRIGVAIVGDGRLPPQPAHMFLVLPEIVDVAVIDVAGGNPILGVEGFQDLQTDGRVEGITLQPGIADRVLLFHPGKRFLTVDIGEPVIGIVLVAGRRGNQLRECCARTKARAERRQNPFPVLHHTLQ